MKKIKFAMIDWDDHKDKLKQKFPGLTDKDLYFEKGKMEAMLIKLQEKLGLTRHKLFTIIAEI